MVSLAPPPLDPLPPAPPLMHKPFYSPGRDRMAVCLPGSGQGDGLEGKLTNN